MDFELVGLNMEMDIFASQEYSIEGNVTTLMFKDAKVVNPVTIISNPRDVWQFAYDFDDFQAYINSWLFTDKIRIKNLGSLFFSVFDLQLLSGEQMVIGIDIDPVYNQNLNTVDSDPVHIE